MRTFVLSGMLTLASVQMLVAGTIVQWGGGYVSSNEPLAGNAFIGNGIDVDGDLSADDEIGGRAFSITTAFSPANIPPGTYAGTNATFYGGAILGRQNYSGGDTAFNDADVKNQGPNNDSVHLHAQNANHPHDLHAVFLWNQADFLNGGQSAWFDNNSSAVITIGSSNTENLGGAQIRLLVRDGSNNYWVSQTAFTSPTNNSSFTWNNSNQGFSLASDGNWASYNPNAALGGLGAGTDLRFDQANATFSPMKFSSITAVGFLFEQDTFHNNLDFHFEHFTVAAVPEPSSLAATLSGILGVAGWIARRRRRQAA